tara:strand:- start:314 stop:703 length:390 start_codon:yes stop_codon:yes gene_type:complete
MNEQYKKKYLKYKNKYNKFKKKIKGGYTYPAIIGSVSLIALLAYFLKKQQEEKNIMKINIVESKEYIKPKEYIESNATLSNTTRQKESILPNITRSEEPADSAEQSVESPVKSEVDLALALSLENKILR